MTVSVSTSVVTFLGNNSTSVFQYSFILGSASNALVYYTDVDGNQTLLAPSQYTLFLNPPAVGAIWGVGGTLTVLVGGQPIPNGSSLTLQRLVPFTQTTSISNQGDFFPQAVEIALDTLCFEIQQLAARTGLFRGIWDTDVLYSFGDMVVDGANGADTGNYYVCVSSNTSDVWADDLAAGDWVLQIDIQQINADVAAAAASAAAALVSQTAAAASASSAATSASTATTQAGIATTQATNAASSASSASTSASSASTSASSASTSASSASTSASNASTSASSASTSATNASNSAIAAAASAVLAGSTLTATSTSSNTIGTGNFTFTTQANKNFFAGQTIIAASNANSANYIHGQVFSYSGTTLVITETDLGGSGAHSDWNISVSGTQGPSGSTPGFNAISSGTNTSAAMVVGSGASLAPTGTGTIQATNIANTISQGTNITITGAGTTVAPYVINASGTSGATTALDNLASVAINAALVLGTSDAFALGSASKQWSDLFLAEGGVINWDNGDVTITQNGNDIAIAGGSLTVGGAINSNVNFHATDANFTETVTFDAGADVTFNCDYVTATRRTTSQKNAISGPVAGMYLYDTTLNALCVYTTGWQTLGVGASVQVVNTIVSSVATGTTTTPDDDSIPQNTEGDEYMTLSITPTSATNKLKIDIVTNFALSAATNACVALFQDSTANALAASRVAQAAIAGRGCVDSFTYYMTAGTTSATTFKVRIGPDSAATTTFNGVGGARRYGGVMASSITITEILA